MEKINKILESKCLKFICGAGNENSKEIERLAYIYSSAGFNIIDISSKKDVLDAVKRGIARANKTDETAICVSIGVQDDIHFKKAVINKQKCNFCKKCIPECIQNAIFTEDNKILIDEKKCIGCSRCVKICTNDAILTESKYKTPYSMLLPLISEGIDLVEFHCSVSDLNVISENINKVKSIYTGPVGICLDRSKLCDEKITELINIVKSGDETLIFQADGNPMSGCDNEYGTTLQTVAFAQMLESKNIPLYVILSGGTNIKTPLLAKMCNIKYDGIALGSYARKAVKDLIARDDFFDNESVRLQALNIAENIAKELKVNML